MKTSMEYFNMNKEDLTKVVDEYGYTKEECKILDSALKVSFLSNIQEFNSIGVDHELYMKSFNNMTCDEVILMTDGRVALLYN